MLYNNEIVKIKMSFRIILVIFTIFFVSSTKANEKDTLFPTKAGMVLIYEQKNSKGKTDSYSKLTIKNVEGSDNNMTVSYLAEILNKDMKSQFNPPLEIPLTATVKDGKVILDMKQLFVSRQKDPQAQVEISGAPMELPCDLQPGHSLKDAEATMTVDMVIMKLETKVRMTDGKCLGVENVTVPAGTFTCHKIAQTVTSTIMKKQIVSKTISWYAPGIGVVKTETYNDSEQLQDSVELVDKQLIIKN